MTAAAKLLEVDGLEVTFDLPEGAVHAVRGVSFTVDRERVAIVGESGSGKSMTGRALLRLTPHAAVTRARRLAFAGQDLLAMRERELVALRGRRIAMILQDPRFALHPLLPVGEQVAEAYRAHHRAGRREARERALGMLAAVRIQRPERVYKLYPHEVSGGMGQRVMIAMMLICEPELVIADEPTSALDVMVRQEVLRILDDLVRERGLGLLFISHDLGLVRSFCDRVLVMYAGRIVEEIAASDLDQARHPYTRALLAAQPRPENRGRPLPVLVRDAAWAQPQGLAP